jgi:peroxiredoxin
VISPELPSHIATMAARHKFTFPILWDEKSKVSEAFGLAFTLPDDLREVYRSFGNDLAVRDGDPSWRLPVPARFVIDAKGIVRLVEADPDYRYRPDPETTVEALRKVVSGGA